MRLIKVNTRDLGNNEHGEKLFGWWREALVWKGCQRIYPEVIWGSDGGKTHTMEVKRYDK